MIWILSFVGVDPVIDWVLLAAPRIFFLYIGVLLWNGYLHCSDAASNCYLFSSGHARCNEEGIAPCTVTELKILCDVQGRKMRSISLHLGQVVDNGPACWIWNARIVRKHLIHLDHKRYARLRDLSSDAALSNQWRMGLEFPQLSSPGSYVLHYKYRELSQVIDQTSYLWPLS